MTDPYRTEYSDAFHAAFCKSGHGMDQCGYGWAPWDDYHATRKWVERARLFAEWTDWSIEDVISFQNKLEEILSTNVEYRNEW